MSDGDGSRLEMLAEVAAQYYEQNRSQQEIADAVGVSRSAVSRLLSEARERGVVEIVVHRPWRSSAELEERLVTSFGLKAARVLARDGKSYDQTLQGLGRLAATYLGSALRTIPSQHILIAISWGTALYETVMAMDQMELPGSEVVQMIGALDSAGSPTDGPVLARLLAGRLGGRFRYLHAPLTVNSREARDALCEERGIRETLARAGRADVALVGIGTTAPELYSLRRAGYVDDAEAERIREAGAVGDICARHYDQNGTVLDIDLNRRVIGLPLSSLRNIGTVIGVAGDRAKAPAILAALRGGYLDVLVTDDGAAAEVLATRATLATSATPAAIA